MGKLASVTMGHGVEPVRVAAGERENRHSAKPVVFSLINKTTGEARSRVITTVDGAVLGKIMAESVNAAESHLQTGGAKAYYQVGSTFASHESVNHSAKEYVRGNVTINQAENYFSQLKRSLDGTHHHVSREHLQRYVSEFDFRYSTRSMSDARRLGKLADQMVGQRLTYKQVRHQD